MATLKVEFPTGSNHYITLGQVAVELSNRLISLFQKRPDGSRPIYKQNSPFNKEKDWENLLLFHEYFNGDDGEGLGASHQGWTSLVAKLLQQLEGY